MLSSHYDYAGPDAPGGPTTADAALREFLKGMPRLASAHFVPTAEAEAYAEFVYSHPSRGQMLLTFEKRGDSWGISTSESCAALEGWARGQGQ